MDPNRAQKLTAAAERLAGRSVEAGQFPTLKSEYLSAVARESGLELSAEERDFAVQAFERKLRELGSPWGPHT